MSSKGKHWKGQEQIFPGSPTGEPLVINRFDYGSSCGDLKYLGEAKVSSEEIDCKWFIECYEHDNPGSLSAIKTALHRLHTGSTAVTVDSTYSATETLITLTGAGFDLRGYIMPGDYLKLSTGSNSIRRARISDIPAANQIVIESPAVDEVATAITPEDLIITLEHVNTKDYAKRRWDLRIYYEYG